jgi:hypothetical protein
MCPLYLYPLSLSDPGQNIYQNGQNDGFRKSYRASKKRPSKYIINISAAEAMPSLICISDKLLS